MSPILNGCMLNCFLMLKLFGNAKDSSFADIPATISHNKNCTENLDVRVAFEESLLSFRDAGFLGTAEMSGYSGPVKLIQPQ